jgi:cellulose synthase/poly-beta-1,6-N-acetylglucosamine synthase-like glycosyltransferase
MITLRGVRESAFSPSIFARQSISLTDPCGSEQEKRKQAVQETEAESGVNERRSVTVGICASGRSTSLPYLIKLIEEEKLPMSLGKLLIVASECDKDSLEKSKALAREFGNVEIIEERKRQGKAEAINEIIDRATGDYVVFLNGDAIPRPGSVSSLVETISSDPKAAIVSGCPTFAIGRGLTASVLQLMWTVHNNCSLQLNHLSVSNHSSDELMVVRRDALSKLPSDIVNDGAFIAGSAKLKGFKIRFCENAPVEIDLPKRMTDVLGQRRRILFGHFQVWRLTGSAPRTVESLIFISPFLALSVAVKTLARFPGLLRAVPVALVGETISAAFALSDVMRSSDKHKIWKRYSS